MQLIEKKLGKSLEHIGTGGNFLNKTPIALRSRIDKWDLIKLETSVKQRILPIEKNGNQQIRKGSLQTLHTAEG